MGILLFAVFGLVIGLLARALMPGEQKMSILMTMLLGVVGSFVGGVLTSLVTHHRIMEFHTAGIIGSIIGALLVLLVAGMISRRRAHPAL